MQRLALIDIITSIKWYFDVHMAQINGRTYLQPILRMVQRAQIPINPRNKWDLLDCECLNLISGIHTALMSNEEH